MAQSWALVRINVGKDFDRVARSPVESDGCMQDFFLLFLKDFDRVPSPVEYDGCMHVSFFCLHLCLEWVWFEGCMCVCM
jgi:hypothetical protein